jgi:hypothetical protein
MPTFERRYNAFAFHVAALFWWHLVAWWARLEMRAVQEVCCDGLALAAGAATRRCYAETLFQAIEFVQTNRPLQPALVSGFGTNSSLKSIFEMIASLNLNHRFSWWTASFVVACVVAMFCVPVRGQPAPQDQPAKAKGTLELAFDYTALITVTGRVLDAQGKPITGAKVFLASVGIAPKRLAETKSDDKGNYDLGGHNPHAPTELRFHAGPPRRSTAHSGSPGGSPHSSCLC